MNNFKHEKCFTLKLRQCSHDRERREVDLAGVHFSVENSLGDWVYCTKCPAVSPGTSCQSSHDLDLGSKEQGQGSVFASQLHTDK